jgi:hypothetical protein
MLLAIVTAVVICPTAAPSPTSLAPLQEIGHVRAALLCSGLRNRIGPSISGLRVNDAIISQGQVVMAKLRSDALADPRGTSSAGGAGASSEMDDFQMAHLVQAAATNIKSWYLAVTLAKAMRPRERKKAGIKLPVARAAPKSTQS